MARIVSPKLLMLSGIGDSEPLQALHVRVAHALPGVGAGLVDHSAASLVLQTRQLELPPPSTHYPEAGLFTRSSAPEPGYSFDLQFHIVPFAPPWGAVRGTPRGMAITAGLVFALGLSLIALAGR